MGTCTPTPSCPEAPPCTPVSLTECRRRSPPWPPPPSRSRSSLPPRGSTPSGSEAPSWPPCPPSSRCGSPSRSTTSAAPPSSTGSASNLSFQETNPSNNQLGPRVNICLVNGIFFSFSLVVPIPQTKSTHSFSKSKLLLMKQNRPEYFE